jgi:hypothetical protein
MNPNFAAASALEIASLPVQASGEKTGSESLRAASRARQSGKLPPWRTAYLAFFATVFACMTAAVTVVSQDVPLMLGGF